jgi:hypothetical protein
MGTQMSFTSENIQKESHIHELYRKLYVGESS